VRLPKGKKTFLIIKDHSSLMTSHRINHVVFTLPYPFLHLSPSIILKIVNFVSRATKYFAICLGFESSIGAVPS
jgi:hypothetical protein